MSVVARGAVSPRSAAAEPSRRSREVANLWTNWHEIGADATQTGMPQPGSVTAEGGGTKRPTLGGGIGFSREHEPVGGEGSR